MQYLYAGKTRFGQKRQKDVWPSRQATCWSRRLTSVIGLLGYLWLVAAQAAAAQTTVDTPQTHAVLLVAQRTVKPGDALRVGLSLTLKPGWHTYWRTPGDSGLPASVTWILPPGVSASDIAWPV